jgi:hypothetical protein
MELKGLFSKAVRAHEMARHFPLCLSALVAKLILRSKIIINPSLKPK